MFTLKQLDGAKSIPVLMSFLGNGELREYVLKVLGDDQRLAAEVPTQPLLAALNDPNPRVRLPSRHRSRPSRQDRSRAGAVAPHRG